MFSRNRMTQTLPGGGGPANRVLATLPADDYQRLAPHLRTVFLQSRQVLTREGDPLQQLVFPLTALCSLTKAMGNGSSIEVATVGAEGVIGAGLTIGQTACPADVIVQVAGSAQTLALEVIRADIEARGALYESVYRYHCGFVFQLMQTAACNAVHRAEQRCSRWLLTTSDRLKCNEFPVTQATLAVALGVRRPTVTMAMAELSRTGATHHARGVVTILNRSRLEAMSCECYQPVATSAWTSRDDLPGHSGEMPRSLGE